MCVCVYLRLDVLLKAGVPGLLERHEAVAEGLLASPQNIVWDEVLTRKGTSQQKLLHTVLDTHTHK